MSASSMMVPKVVWRQWSDQYVSSTRSSVTVGSRPSARKYCWQKAASAASMARPMRAISSPMPALSSSLKPSTTPTSGGSG